jgi:hypothetical protein
VVFVASEWRPSIRVQSIVAAQEQDVAESAAIAFHPNSLYSSAQAKQKM